MLRTCSAPGCSTWTLGPYCLQHEREFAAVGGAIVTAPAPQPPRARPQRPARRRSPNLVRSVNQVRGFRSEA
jgi:hypothetical protein